MLEPIGLAFNHFKFLHVIVEPHVYFGELRVKEVLLLGRIFGVSPLASLAEVHLHFEELVDLNLLHLNLLEELIVLQRGQFQRRPLGQQARLRVGFAGHRAALQHGAGVEGLVRDELRVEQPQVVLVLPCQDVEVERGRLLYLDDFNFALFGKLGTFRLRSFSDWLTSNCFLGGICW